MCYYPWTGVSLCFPCEIVPLSFGRARWARRCTGISTLEKWHNTMMVYIGRSRSSSPARVVFTTPVFVRIYVDDVSVLVR